MKSPIKILTQDKPQTLDALLEKIEAVHKEYLALRSMQDAITDQMAANWGENNEPLAADHAKMAAKIEACGKVLHLLASRLPEAREAEYERIEAARAEQFSKLEREYQTIEAETQKLYEQYSASLERQRVLGRQLEPFSPHTNFDLPGYWDVQRRWDADKRIAEVEALVDTI